MLQRVLLKVGGAHTRGFTPRGLYAHARFCGLPNIATIITTFRRYLTKKNFQGKTIDTSIHEVHHHKYNRNDCSSPTPPPESPSSPSESPISQPESPITSPASPQASTNETSASQEPPAKQPRICHSDAGVFVHSHPVSDNDKFCLIQEHFVPAPRYKFPQASNRRSFQHKWLSRYQWLRYSEQDDGGYCLPCALFFRATVSFRSDHPGVLVTKPLKNFQKALEILNKHEGKQFHKSSVVQMDEFVKVMTNQQPSIRTRLNQATAKQIAANRQKLCSIVETIVLCGRQ